MNCRSSIVAGREAGRQGLVGAKEPDPVEGMEQGAVRVQVLEPVPEPVLEPVLEPVPAAVVLRAGAAVELRHHHHHLVIPGGHRKPSGMPQMLSAIFSERPHRSVGA
jgi:hypothetical protein